VSPAKEKVYAGPLVVVTDCGTCSAAEDFVAAIQENKRGIVVGEKTAGSTGQPLFYKIPDVGIVRISAVRCLKMDGSPIQIIPDVKVSPSIAGLQSGRDEILEKALETAHQMVAISNHMRGAGKP